MLMHLPRCQAVPWKLAPRMPGRIPAPSPVGEPVQRMIHVGRDARVEDCPKRDAQWKEIGSDWGDANTLGAYHLA
jgi:hypothetical protein